MAAASMMMMNSRVLTLKCIAALFLVAIISASMITNARALLPDTLVEAAKEKARREEAAKPAAAKQAENVDTEILIKALADKNGLTCS